MKALAPLVSQPVEVWSQLAAAVVAAASAAPTVEFIDEPTVVAEVATVVERRVTR